MESKKDHILRLRAQGLSYNQIAKEVGVSPNYVYLVNNPDIYRRRIREKTRKESQKNLLRRMGELIEDDPSFAKRVKEALKNA